MEPTHDGTTDTAPRGARERAFACVSAGTGIVGFISLGISAYMVARNSMEHPVMLALACALSVITLLSEHFDVSFKFGGRPIDVTLASAPLLLAAVIMPPGYAGVVLALSMVPQLKKPSLGLFQDMGSQSFALLLASLAALMIPHHTANTSILAAALIAAVVFELVHVGDGLLYYESQERGAALGYLKGAAHVTGFDVFLPTVALAVAGPFAGYPLLMIGVLVAFQIVTYLGLRIVHSEQVHRKHSAYLKDTFSRYIPESVVAQLSDEEAEVMLGGELREISCMFCDVRNFTGWSERLGPQQVITELNELMTEITQSIFDTEGTLDKFTGDGLMAFWGAPVDQPDHADRACRTALDMLERVDALNVRRVAEGKPCLYLGIGIHSGTALVGNVGHVNRLDYTAIGDTINLTARLEAKTKDYACSALISSDTFSMLASPEFGPMDSVGEIHVKGREDGVEGFILAYGERHAPKTAPAAPAADLSNDVDSTADAA